MHYLAEIIHNIQIPAFLIDSGGKLIDANKEFTSLRQRFRSSIFPGSPVTNILNEFPLYQILRDESAHAFRFPGMLMDDKGSSFDLEVLGASDDHSSRYFFCLLLDTQPEMANVAELRSKERNLARAQRLAKIGHWELDLRSNRLYWSDEVYRIFGMQPQEFGATYEAFLDRVHPEDRDLVNTAYSQSVRNENSYEITHRILTIDGGEKFVEEHCEHELDADGNVVLSIGTVHDITETMQAQRELLLASRVFSHTIEAIVITDAEMKILKANDAFYKISGYSPEEVLGHTPKILASGWHDSDFYKDMWNSINNKGSWKGEIWDRKKNGELYAAEITIFRVNNQYDQTTHYVAISNDITEKKETERKMNQLVYFDFLTGLPNRNQMQEHITRRIDLAKLSEESFAVFMLDLDNFKTLNDSLGHQAGDRVLRTIGKRIKDVLDTGGAISRIGGDEFLGMINTIKTPTDAGKAIEDLIEAISDPVEVDGSTFTLGMSAGISIYPDDGIDFGILIQNAESAMYHAKNLGRGTYRFFTESMYITARDRLDLEHKLRTALNNRELHIQYQPKICLDSDRLLGMEALIRWTNQELGFVSPAKFIPVAEEIGVILSLGRWVLKQSCSEIRPLLKDYPNIRLSVNVSGRQLYQPGFYEEVMSILEETKFPPENLEFEITESVILENEKQALRLLEEIRHTGITLSLDDFGTGYSSLSILKHLPVHTLKIDRSFVKDLDSISNDIVFIRAIISLAKNLNLGTIAEGAETKKQVEILRQEKCDAIQGYYFAKPLDMSDLIAYLEKRGRNTSQCL